MIDRLAAQHGSPEAIATAWITRHPAQMVVLSTTTPQQVSDAAGGSAALTRAERVRAVPRRRLDVP